MDLIKGETFVQMNIEQMDDGVRKVEIQIF